MRQEVPRTMQPPVYVYYQLTGFYQNHKRYVRSVSWKQMSGRAGALESLPSCEPRRYVRGRLNQSLPDAGAIHPCGLLPASLFNDTISICMTCPTEQGATTCDKTITEPVSLWDNSQLTGQLFASNKRITNFNNVPGTELGGNLTGVLRQHPHLIMWTLVAAGPDVIKPWAVITQPIQEGCVLHINITSCYHTAAWGGEKHVLLATRAWTGSSRNLVLPLVFLIWGAIMVLAALYFLALSIWSQGR